MQGYSRLEAEHGLLGQQRTLFCVLCMLCSAGNRCRLPSLCPGKLLQIHLQAHQTWERLQGLESERSAPRLPIRREHSSMWKALGLSRQA